MNTEKKPTESLDFELLQLVFKARKTLKKSPIAYHGIKALQARVQIYADANGYGRGEIMDMALVDFLHRRGVNVAALLADTTPDTTPDFTPDNV